HTFQLYRDVLYFAPGPVTNPVSFGAYDINWRSYLWIVDATQDDATWYSFPALRDRYLYYSTCGILGDNWEFIYYALDRETGDVIWQYIDDSDLGVNTTEPSYTLFRHNLELLDYMAPSLWGNLVIYTSGDTVVRALNARNGKIVWKRSFEYPTTSAPTIAGDRVYFGLKGGPDPVHGTRSPKLVCLSARDGKLLWEIDIEGAVLSAPVIAGKWLVFGTDRNNFYVLEEVY
ncbi:MAG TPA: PQQ-binding-like beta-propeller repeat protein, partial [Spirochaetia bacterium]|nr:PQQ-binding-like beta-propeller repeat protein [Spirochaetia bacterium]